VVRLSSTEGVADSRSANSYEVDLISIVPLWPIIYHSIRMIALFLLLAAQAAPNAPPAAQQNCVRAVGSEIVVCGTPPAQQQQGAYRIPRLRPQSYGPALPSAQTDLGHGVRASLRGQANNSSRARRNRSAATLSVPF
jgi:hypothetical protein